MSIADRDYMQNDFDGKQRAVRPSFYKRFLFSIWLFIRTVFKKR